MRELMTKLRRRLRQNLKTIQLACLLLIMFVLVALHKDQLSNNENSMQSSNIDQKVIFQRSNKIQFKGKKVVHLDLKGAPPKPNYYKQFFQLLSSLGVDGVLIEYEDMFPYSGAVEVIRRPEAYTKAELQQIFIWAKQYKLEIIPLVQTFGHLEFVLKHAKFKSLSEVDSPRRAICPSNSQSLVLIKDLIAQILSLHPDSKYIHIGGDEVFELGKCPKCKSRRVSGAEIYVTHIKSIVQYIQSNWPSVGILFWEDMIREWTTKDMKKLNGTIPMVWAYRRNLDDVFPNKMWENYGKVFNRIWIASAFKGAIGQENNLVPIDYHVSNHDSWMEQIRSQENNINFEGIVITGWSRFDHHKPLCELLPAGIPSLALCIGVLNKGMFTNSLHYKVSNALGCQKNISLQYSFVAYQVETCNFAGSKIFKIVSQLQAMTRDLMILHGYFNDPETKFTFTDSPLLQHPQKSFNAYKKRLKDFEQQAKQVLSEIYYLPTVKEWIEMKCQRPNELLNAITKKLQFKL